MIIEIKSNGQIDARAILKQAGYKRNENKSGSFWLDSNNKEYEFLGWGPSENDMMPKNPQYIGIKELKP